MKNNVTNYSIPQIDGENSSIKCDKKDNQDFQVYTYSTGNYISLSYIVCLYFRAFLDLLLAGDKQYQAIREYRVFCTAWRRRHA